MSVHHVRRGVRELVEGPARRPSGRIWRRHGSRRRRPVALRDVRIRCRQVRPINPSRVRGVLIGIAASPFRIARSLLDLDRRLPASRSPYWSWSAAFSPRFTPSRREAAVVGRVLPLSALRVLGVLGVLTVLKVLGFWFAGSMKTQEPSNESTLRTLRTLRTSVLSGGLAPRRAARP